MKKIIFLLAIVFILSSCNGKEVNNNKANNPETEKKEVITETEATDENKEYIIDESDFVKGAELIKYIEAGELNQEEKDGLILMREEEKLAYDVYVTLYEKWGQKIFNNISGSEQTHMNAVGDLLSRYNIKDPIKETTVGVFTSEKLQKLYNDLIEKGNISLKEALIVGITIEDLDIYDLVELSKETKREDILIVYDNLTRGSRNHMRAFHKNLERQGGTYTPQFISEEEYKSIIEGEQERGGSSSKGNGRNK